MKTGKEVKPVKVSVMAAFGSTGLNALHDAGIKLDEKPGYWADLDSGYAKKYALDELKLQLAKNVLQKAGIKLKTYSWRDIWNTEPRGPLATVNRKVADTTFIVEMGDGKRYLVDTTGASTYIRNWAHISA